MLFKRLFAVAVLAALPLIAGAADSAGESKRPLIMVVQPINSEATTEANYKPLAEYLSEQTGRKIELQTVNNYHVFWGITRRKDQFDIALDAAHMTSYRIAAHGHRVVAKVPSQVSYSLVTSEDSMILDIDELFAKRVATLPSPGLGAIRLLEMYPNMMHQPVLVRAENTEDAIEKLRANEVAAAIIPTPLVSQYDGISVVEVTDAVPSPAISVSSRVSDQTASALRKVLVDMQNSEKGKAVLKTARLPGFEAARDSDYSGYHELLEGVWGYDHLVGQRNGVAAN